ncbi:MAG: hypothetical protein AVDCRST_MAG53-2530, partial [uncultured Solirubrobacteraceae bacterium]
ARAPPALPPRGRRPPAGHAGMAPGSGRDGGLSLRVRRRRRRALRPRSGPGVAASPEPLRRRDL